MNLSSFKIQDFWMKEIAPRYFPLEDSSNLRIGMFGYLNDVLSNIAEDSFNMHSIISREIYPNRAVLPESIYAYASLSGFEDFYATPARITVTIALRVKDILEKSTYNPNTKAWALTLSRFSKINIDFSIPYMLEHDIQIIYRDGISDSVRSQSFSVMYDLKTGGYGAPAQSPYISAVVFRDGDDDYIVFTADVVQQLNITHRLSVHTRDVVESVHFEIPFEGKLAGFNVFYKEHPASDSVLINKYVMDSFKPEKGEDFVFFSISSDNKIQLTFSAHPGYFRPEPNSELHVEVYITEGVDGNFKFESDKISFEAISDEGINLTNLNYSISSLSDSAGGKDGPNLLELKTHVVNEFSMRNNIITDLDLKRFFESITGNTKMIFYKRRDDVIERLYSAFILIRNSKNEIVPSNTINLLLFEDELKASNPHGAAMIMPNMAFVDDGWSESFVLSEIQDRASLLRADNQSNQFMYSTPFLIKINSNPLSSSYYLNSTFEDYGIFFDHLNTFTHDEYITTRIHIERNAVKSNIYEITANIRTTKNIQQAVLDPDDNVVVIGMLETNGVIDAYFNFDLVSADNNSFNIRAELETHDEITPFGNLVVIGNGNHTRLYRPSPTLQIPLTDVEVTQSETRLIVAVYATKDPSENNIEIFHKSDYDSIVPNMDTWILSNTFKTTNPIVLHEDVSTLMKSGVAIRMSPYDQKPGTYFKINKVPVFRYLYLHDNQYFQEIISEIRRVYAYVKRNIDRMENGFDVDIKPYNTYGSSKYFTIGRDRVYLDSVAIEIRLVIAYAVTVTPEVANEIRHFIVDFVEKTNNIVYNFIYVSDMITAIKNRFEMIRYVEFEGFNGYDSSRQIIENVFLGIESLTKEQLRDFVPEYINVSKHHQIENGRLEFRPKVTINFV